jgi:hypothetical protein
MDISFFLFVLSPTLRPNATYIPLTLHWVHSLVSQKCFRYPSFPPSQVGECHIWSYTEARLSLEVAPLMRDTIPQTLEFKKGESRLSFVSLQPKELSYYCQVHIPNEMVQVYNVFMVSRLEKMFEGTVELSSTEWSHWSQIALSTTSNQVIDHREHMMGHKTTRLYKLHRRPRDLSFQSSWLPILPVKVFHRIYSLLPCRPSPFKISGRDFF